MLFEKMYDSESAPHTFFHVILQFLVFTSFGINLFNLFLGIQSVSIDFAFAVIF